jgi:hypothetical protein
LHRERLGACGLEDRTRVLLEVHREIGVLLVEAVVQHADDVGMVQRGQDAELTRQGEALVRAPGIVVARVRCVAEPDLLEGHDPARQAIQHTVHGPRRSPTEIVDQLVALR